MRQIIIFWLVMSCFPFFGYSQTTQDFDFVSPFYEEFAAVKQGDQWGFININGEIVIDFRNDLVSTKTSEGEYPIFTQNRCMIVRTEKDIQYFGYIDTKGKVIVAPEYLNATNFQFDHALVLKLYKEISGYNHLLDKFIVYYTYVEEIIDIDGNSIKKLTEPQTVVLLKKMLPEPPKFTAKLVSNNLVSVKDKKGKVVLKKYKELEEF